MSIYKASFSVFFGRIIILFFMIQLFGLISDKLNNSLEFGFIIIVFYFIIIFFRKTIMIVNIDRLNKKLILHFKQYIFKEIVEEYKLDNISFSFDWEIGAKGVKQKVFNIREKNKIIFKIDSSSYFWSDKKLNKIIKDFEEHQFC